MVMSSFIMSFLVVLCGIWKMPNAEGNGIYQLTWLVIGLSGMFGSMYLRHLGW